MNHDLGSELYNSKKSLYTIDKTTAVKLHFLATLNKFEHKKLQLQH